MSLRYTLLALLITVLPVTDSIAASVAGGDMYYECLGGDNYRVSLNYMQPVAVGPAFRATETIYVVDLDDTTNFVDQLANKISEFVIPLNGVGCITPLAGAAGPFDAELALYQTTFNLPVNGNGYLLVFQRCCRNQTVNNTADGNTTGSYTLLITRDALLSCNNSPTFRNPPPIQLCKDNEFYYDRGADDLEGDDVTYSFTSPLNGSLNATCTYIYQCSNFKELPPYSQIAYDPGFSEAFPMGISAPVPIVVDPQTGEMTGIINTVGMYMAPMVIEEHRNGVLLSRSISDFIFRVRLCDLVIARTFPEYRSCSRTIDFTNLSSGETAWLWDFGDGNTSTFENPTHTYASSGTYVVTLRASSPQCNDTYTSTVIIEGGHIVDFSVDEICVGSAYQFDNLTTDPDGTITGYEWTIEGNTYSDFEPLVTFNNSGSIDVQLATLADSGCVDTAVMQMTVRDPIVVDVDISTIYCSNTNVVFTNNSTGYIESVLWDFGDGNTSTDFSPVHDYATAGNYSVTVTMFSSACGNEVYNQVTEVQSAPPIDLGPSLEICGTGVTTYTMDTTGFGNATITWSTGDMGPTANLTGGTTTLSVIVDNSGCITMDTVVVTNSAPITVDVDIPDNGCQASAVSFTNNSTGNIEGVLWDFGDGNTSTAMSPSHTYNATGQYTVTVTMSNTACGPEVYSEMITITGTIPVDLGPPIDVCTGIIQSYTLDTTGYNGATISWSTGDTGPTAFFSGGSATLTVTVDNQGCISMDDVSINSLDSIIVDIDIPDLYCSNTPLAFINNSTGTIQSVLWDFGDGNTSTNFSPVHSYLSGGTFTVAVDLINSVCGSKTYTEDVLVQDPLSVELGAPRDICIGSVESFSIDTTGFNGASILWSTGETVPEVFVTGGTITNLSVTVDNGCIANDNVAINTIDSISLDVQILDNYCAGVPITFINNSTGDIESVLWNFGDGNTSTAFSPTHTYSFGGNFNVTVDLINTICGSKSYGNTVAVLDPVSFDLGPERDICVGSVEVFTIDTTGFGNATIMWSTGETTPSVSVTGGTISNLSVTINNGCDATDNVDINSFDSIALDIQVDDSYCAADAVSFINNSTGDIFSIFWDFGDGTSSTEFSPTHTYTSGGQFTVDVDLINTVCGSKNFTKSIKLVAPLPVDLGQPRDICPGLIDSFFIDTTGFNGATITWSTGETSTPQVIVAGGITELSVTVDNGCITTDQVLLTSECPVVLPSAFVPGGINNTFNVIDNNIESYELRIYNRWGEEIFTTSDFNIGWDGTYKGVNAEMDVYVYIIDGIKIGGKPSICIWAGSTATIRPY